MILLMEGANHCPVYKQNVQRHSNVSIANIALALLFHNYNLINALTGEKIKSK